MSVPTVTERPGSTRSGTASGHDPQGGVPVPAVPPAPAAAVIGDARAVHAKPRLRGVSHHVAFFAAAVLAPVLVLTASTPAHRVALAVYGGSLLALFGCSALLHRGTWSERVLPWVRRLDHSTIFVFIAGTYTAVAALALPAGQARPILAAVWCGAAAGIGVSVVWVGAPRWVTAACYLAVGWVAVAALPWLWEALDPGRFALLTVGGVVYTTGAVVYARRRPDPWPAVFGFHEVFHALVIVAATSHLVLVVTLLAASG